MRSLRCGGFDRSVSLGVFVLLGGVPGVFSHYQNCVSGIYRLCCGISDQCAGVKTLFWRASCTLGNAFGGVDSAAGHLYAPGEYCAVGARGGKQLFQEKEIRSGNKIVRESL